MGDRRRHGAGERATAGAVDTQPFAQADVNGQGRQADSVVADVRQLPRNLPRQFLQLGADQLRRHRRDHHGDRGADRRDGGVRGSAAGISRQAFVDRCGVADFDVPGDLVGHAAVQHRTQDRAVRYLARAGHSVYHLRLAAGDLHTLGLLPGNPVGLGEGRENGRRHTGTGIPEGDRPTCRSGCGANGPPGLHLRLERSAPCPVPDGHRCGDHGAGGDRELHRQFAIRGADRIDRGGCHGDHGADYRFCSSLPTTDCRGIDVGCGEGIGAMAEIVLDRVTKCYPDGATAVHEVSLTIAEGEFIILVGPSGCGKSTTLNMIAGLEDISSGELRIGGERVNEKAPKDRDMAMVFQSYALYPHMTVRQNIAFPLTLAKMKKAEIADKVEDTARILDLTDVLDRKPSQLSGGQRQRVAMGRAIVRHPKAFLMDEPLSNLDAKLRVQMRGEIARLQRRLGTTTVYVTHDQTEAMTLGDRVVVMRGGVVQQIGTPDELYERPANLFVAGFIGSPAMNFFPAGLTETGLSLTFGEITLTQPVLDLLGTNSAPKEGVVGVRPEPLQDAALIDAYRRISSLSFEVNVDLVESLGADKYVYFTAEGPVVHSDQLSELDDETGGPEHEFVARVHAASKAAKGKKFELAFDTSQLAVFDPDSGANLTIVPPPETQ